MTRQVHHIGFPGQLITINAEDFDPAIHADTPWDEQDAGEAVDTRAERAKALAKLPAEEVRALAEAASIEYTNKAAAIEALLAAEFPEG